MNRIKREISMKRHNWFFVLAVAIIVPLHQYDIIRLDTFIAMLTSVIAFYLAILQQKISDDNLFKELFTSFNSKYDRYNDLINKCDRRSKKELDEDEKNLIIDYFNLCAEEYLWYKKGRIPEEVWKAWKKGIQYNINITLINELYNQERKQDVSYYGLFTELEKNL